MSEEKVLSEKEQRQQDCIRKVHEVLKEANCVLQPIMVFAPDDKGQMGIRADVACIALSSILENTQ